MSDALGGRFARRPRAERDDRHVRRGADLPLGAEHRPALYALLANAVGIGVGPPLFGWISDLLAPHFGGESLRMSLVVAAILGFWPAFHLWQAQRHLRATEV